MKPQQYSIVHRQFFHTNSQCLLILWTLISPFSTPHTHTHTQRRTPIAITYNIFYIFYFFTLISNESFCVFIYELYCHRMKKLKSKRRNFFLSRIVPLFYLLFSPSMSELNRTIRNRTKPKKSGEIRAKPIPRFMLCHYLALLAALYYSHSFSTIPFSLSIAVWFHNFTSSFVHQCEAKKPSQLKKSPFFISFRNVKKH